MRTLEAWLDSYAEDHQNETNQKFHLVCVPAIFLSVVGLLHLIPYRIAGEYPLGDLLIAVALCWYLFLSVKAFAMMVVQLAVCVGIATLLERNFGAANAAWTFLAIFVVAWIGQFYGHKVEGKKPSFFTDLQYLLIGPLWVWLGKH